MKTTTLTSRTKQIGVRVPLGDMAAIRHLIAGERSLADFVKTAIREKLQREELRSNAATVG